MSTRTHTIDYLKFVVKTDQDNFAQSYQQTFVNFNKYLLDFHPTSAHMRCSVTKIADNGQRTYVLECWGTAADLFVEMAPPSWWPHLRRCDVREYLENVTGDELMTLAASFILAPRSNITVSPISSPARRKTNQRDIGGKGVRFGSRTSEKHLVAYARGDETPVLEFRLQDKAAQAAGRDVKETCGLAGPEARRKRLVDLCLYERDKFMRKHLECVTALNFAMLAQHLHKSCPQPAEWMTREEMDFDVEWSAMTEEEQAPELATRWDLTPEGEHRLGR